MVLRKALRREERLVHKIGGGGTPVDNLGPGKQKQDKKDHF